MNDDTREMIEKLHRIEVKVSKDLATLTTSHTGLKQAVEKMSSSVSDMQQNLAGGQEKFLSLEHRISTLETKQEENDKDVRTRVWKVLVNILTLAGAGGLLLWGVLSSGS